MISWRNVISIFVFSVFLVLGSGANGALKRDPSLAAAQRPRVALVIGNTYGTNLPRLQNAANDARLITRALQQVGFDVATNLDVGAADFRGALDLFIERLKKLENPVVFFYFSGSGVEYDGRNYLFPNDSKIDNKHDVELEAIVLNDVILQIETANTSSLNFILLDACREDPFRLPAGSRGLSPEPRGFAPVPVQPGDRTVVLYATTPGGLSFDSVGGKSSNGPFAEALAKYITEPGLEWADVYRRVQFDVIEATSGKQKPTAYGLPSTPFYFALQVSPPAQETASDLRTQAGRGLSKLEHDGRLSYAYDGSYALLIGVSHYQDEKAWDDLPGVDRDITNIERVLRDVHGFSVTKVRSPTSAQLQEALRNFIKIHGRKENARLLIYYAGHGYTTENRKHKIGWIVPSDAPHPLDAPEEFAMTAFSMRRIEEFSEIIGAKHVLWVFDSCFSGSIFQMEMREGPMSPFEEELLSKPVRRIITSGSEGEKVPDTSVFAELFVEALSGKKIVGRNPDIITGNDLGRFLKEEVLKYRRKLQTPQSGTVIIKGFDEGDVVFRLDERLKTIVTIPAR